MDSPEGSANDVMTAEIDRRVNEAVNQIRDKIELDVRYISSNADIWYFINSCLNNGLQQVVATFYAAGAYKGTLSYLKALQAGQRDAEGDIMISSINHAKGKEKVRARHRRNSSSSEDLPQLVRDTRKCFNCNQIGHIAIRCPKPKRAYPAKVKKAKKREVSSDKSPIEELGSSEAEESSGKE
ncbi:pol-like protein [Colletotrichum kahawae]|uniref:Pol-like protein n=1 Tax=Colletotrichum kahawae TaxID=34407 RepID=A0AAE0D0C3_COLKA|nr:pol-like protein [Colletotrichum kahawae]